MATPFSTSSGDSALFTGNVDLAPSGAGGTHTFNIGGGNHLGFQGVISGGAGSNIIKIGASQWSSMVPTRTEGTTTVNQGFLGIGADVLPNVAGPLGISDTPVLFGNNGTNTGGQFFLSGQITMGRDLIYQTVNGTGTFNLRGQTLNNSQVTGGIFITSGQTLIVDQVETNSATFRGGQLDLAGPITGAGALSIGNNDVQGTVRLSANSNGFGTSTYSGGTTLQAARLQIGSDTYFTGTTAAPTIISGPLGSGTLTFGAGNGGAGGAIEAFGGERTIVNALGTWAGDQANFLTPTGHNSLTFTRDLNISGAAALQNRTINVLQTQDHHLLWQPQQLGCSGANLLKGGVGTLVLSGTNTQSNALANNVNYGTTAFIDAPVCWRQC